MLRRAVAITALSAVCGLAGLVFALPASARPPEWIPPTGHHRIAPQPNHMAPSFQPRYVPQFHTPNVRGPGPTTHFTPNRPMPRFVAPYRPHGPSFVQTYPSGPRPGWVDRHRPYPGWVDRDRRHRRPGFYVVPIPVPVGPSYTYSQDTYQQDVYQTDTYQPDTYQDDTYQPETDYRTDRTYTTDDDGTCRYETRNVHDFDNNAHPTMVKRRVRVCD